MLLQIFATAMLALGEFLAIYSEVIMSHRVEKISLASWQQYLYPFFIITIAGIPMIIGYATGIKAFKSIWVVSAISISCIVFLEPILNYAVFREFPSHGQLIGVIFCLLGLLSFVLFK